MNVQEALIGVIPMQIAATLRGVTPVLARLDTQAMVSLATVSLFIFQSQTRAIAIRFEAVRSTFPAHRAVSFANLAGHTGLRSCLLEERNKLLEERPRRFGDPFALFGAISQLYNMWLVTCQCTRYVRVGLAWASDE